ncbi:hypothetical protein CIB48_g9570 [Xylaria polymorpha]|nr:hypothetical protein CIB48_g9570 [Xylaria polymorpha]
MKAYQDPEVLRPAVRPSKAIVRWARSPDSVREANSRLACMPDSAKRRITRVLGTASYKTKDNGLDDHHKSRPLLRSGRVRSRGEFLTRHPQYALVAYRIRNSLARLYLCSARSPGSTSRKLRRGFSRPPEWENDLPDHHDHFASGR